MKIEIQILNATGITGIYPFVVVCFDGDIQREVHKTEAATNTAGTATWDHTFELDLTHHVKSLIADGRPEPSYLTFFLFDTGAPGVPSLGSAGVLLSTVRETGIAQGDFPIVNGPGSMSLIVTTDKKRKEEEGFWHSDGAKIAGAAGVTALAAGLGGLAFSQMKKKKKKKKAEEAIASRGIGGEADEEGGSSSSSSSSSSSDDEKPQEEQQQTSSRPWWDPTSSSSSEEEDDDEEEGHRGHDEEAEEEGDAAEEEEDE